MPPIILVPHICQHGVTYSNHILPGDGQIFTFMVHYAPTLEAFDQKAKNFCNPNTYGQSIWHRKMLRMFAAANFLATVWCASYTNTTDQTERFIDHMTQCQQAYRCRKSFSRDQWAAYKLLFMSEYVSHNNTVLLQSKLITKLMQIAKQPSRYVFHSMYQV